MTFTFPGIQLIISPVVYVMSCEDKETMLSLKCSASFGGVTEPQCHSASQIKGEGIP